MLDHVWSVFCARSSVDRESNTASLFEAIEEVVWTIEHDVGTGVVMPLSGELVSLWIRRDQARPARGTSRIIWEAPEQAPCQLGDDTVLDLARYERLRIVNRIAGLPVFGSGRYYLVHQYRDDKDADWMTVARVPLSISLLISGA